MRDGTILVNESRGGLVQGAALVRSGEPVTVGNVAVRGGR